MACGDMEGVSGVRHVWMSQMYMYKCCLKVKLKGCEDHDDEVFDWNLQISELSDEMNQIRSIHPLTKHYF